MLLVKTMPLLSEMSIGLVTVELKNTTHDPDLATIMLLSVSPIPVLVLRDDDDDNDDGEDNDNDEDDIS